MFMDSVVRDRVEIAKPWREYRKEGDSLFVWRLLFGLAAFAVFGALFAVFFIKGAEIYDSGQGIGSTLPLILGLGLVTLAVVLVWGYIVLFLKDFVAALMYKDRVGAGEGWRRFLHLLGQHPLHFVGYALFVFVLILVFVFVVIVAGLITCCIGWFLLVIPYIGTVVTLPFWYTLRAFSLEFLAQFGPEYNVFPPAAAPAEPTLAAPAPVGG